MDIEVNKKYNTTWGTTVLVNKIRNDEAGIKLIHGLTPISGTDTQFIYRENEIVEEPNGDINRIMSEATKEREELNLPTCYANLVELVNRCEKIHSYTGWYCMSCDSEVDATYTEHCASCGTPLDGTNLTGNLVESAKDELKLLLHNEKDHRS